MGTSFRTIPSSISACKRLLAAPVSIPAFVAINYQARYNSMYTGEPAEPAIIEYSLGNDLEIMQVDFMPLSPVFINNPRYPYLNLFTGKMYFYN